MSIVARIAQRIVAPIATRILATLADALPRGRARMRFRPRAALSRGAAAAMAFAPAGGLSRGGAAAMAFAPIGALSRGGAAAMAFTATGALDEEGGEPTEVTLYSDGTYDDTLEATDAVAANVLAATEAGSVYGGGGVLHYAAWALYDGTDYYSDMMLFGIDTSSIPNGATITGVEFRIKAASGVTGSTGADLQLRIAGSRAGMPAVGDWLTPAQFAALPLAAVRPFDPGLTEGVVSFTSEAGFKDLINKEGVTFFALCTAGWAAGATPTEDGFTPFLLGDAVLEAERPRLVIEYTE